MTIIQSLCINHPCYKVGKKITVKGLMLHSVGCNQPNAEVFVRKWNKSNAPDVLPHAVIDANNGNAHQTLPWTFRGWHGGGSSNDTHIGVEMCEPACIQYTGGADFTCSDYTTARRAATTTYNSAVALFAYLCREYKLDPLKPGVIVSHSEGYKRGIASGHADPEHLWRGLGLTYTMDTFRKAVHEAMNGTIKNTEEPGTLYRVQVGAFKNKENAEAMMKRLKTAGYADAFITTSTDNSVLYRVQVGAFKNKSNAESMLKKLKAAGYSDAFITSTDSKKETVKPVKKPVTEIAKEVIDGKWGNGEARKKLLQEAGYDYNEVQKIVNKLI